MPKKDTLTKPVNLRFAPEVREGIEKIADKTGLQHALLYQLIVRAGVEAIKRNNYKFISPLEFYTQEVRPLTEEEIEKGFSAFGDIQNFATSDKLPHQKKCKSCGETFLCGNKKKQYCSDECKKNYNYKPETFLKKKCLICSEEFEFSSHSPHGKYCSKKCVNVANRINLKGLSPYSIFSRDDFTCIYCGKNSIQDSIQLELDHIIPKSKGGGELASNIITSCKSCNRSKNANVFDDNRLAEITNVVRRRCLDASISPFEKVNMIGARDLKEEKLW